VDVEGLENEIVESDFEDEALAQPDFDVETLSCKLQSGSSSQSSS
jgi:hypothetical protein